MLYIGLNHLKRNEDDHQKSNVFLYMSARFFFKGEVVVKDRNEKSFILPSGLIVVKSGIVPPNEYSSHHLVF
jgi:hypothetical protein